MITKNKDYFIKLKFNNKKNFQILKGLCFEIDNKFIWFKIYKRNGSFKENGFFIPINYNKNKILIKECLK